MNHYLNAALGYPMARLVKASEKWRLPYHAWLDRRIAVTETTDWREFTSPELVLQTDSPDSPLTQPHGMPVR